MDAGVPDHIAFSYADIAELLPPVSSTTRGTAAKGNYAYALTREGNLYTFDVSDILSLPSFETYEPIGSPLIIGSKGYGLLDYENYLYAYHYSITVINIQSPESPSIVSTVSTLNGVYNMVRSGNYLIACERNYVEVFSLTTPSAPLKIGELFIGTEGWSAAVYGDHLYVAGGWDNPMLHVIDFSDPTDLSLLNSMPLDELPYHMGIVDNKIITSCTSSAQLWSLSDPLNPSELDSISIPWSGRVFAQDSKNLIFNGKVLYVDNSSFSIRQTFDTHAGGQIDGFPYGSDVTYNEGQSIIFLAQSERVLVAARIPDSSSSKTIYVDDGFSDDPLNHTWDTIQEGVDDASDGNTVIVYAGEYVENVDVNKSITLQGEGSDAVTVTAADAEDDVFYVTADWVNIIGFTVECGDVAGHSGISLEAVDHCNISKNRVSNSAGCGISLHWASNNNITKNNASNNWGGICLYGSCSNDIEDNTASNNVYGMYFHRSSNNLLTNNTMSGNWYSFSVDGTELSEFVNAIDITNRVNGKPIYYWINKQNEQVPSDAGAVILINCTNMIVKDLTLTNNGAGVQFAYVKKSKIENINVMNNDLGIYLKYSSNNDIIDSFISNGGIRLASSSNNNITNNEISNSWSGFSIFSSFNNVISLNNFIDNSNNVLSYGSSANIWNSTSPITYTYNGNTYTNYLGNYWDDYTDFDADNNGIWDNPYSIDGDKDNHPLVEPFENYIEPGQKGDLNGDDQITPADATIALAIAAGGGSASCDPATLDAADVSGDNRVTSLDALMILQAAAGAIEL
jgi:parallel beta-helix repeat protein